MTTRKEYTSPAEDAAAIRAEYRRRGWSSRDISVRAGSFSMGSAIRVKIKSPGIPLAEVQEIASEIAEHIRRCEITGDILGGGNRYVTAALEYQAMRPIVDELRGRLEELTATPDITSGGWHYLPFVAGVEVARLGSGSAREFVVRLPGEDRQPRFSWDAAGAAALVAEHLFQRYPDPLGIARAVSA